VTTLVPVPSELSAIPVVGDNRFQPFGEYGRYDGVGAGGSGDNGGEVVR